MKKMEVPVLPQAVEITDEGFKWKSPRTKAERRKQRASWIASYRAAGLQIAKHVYVIEASNGLVKIGTAFDIELRCGQLQAMSPVQLRLHSYVLNGGEKLERKLHAMLNHRRSHGEWFEVDLQTVKMFIAELVETWGKW